MKHTNYAAGPRGINLKGGTTLWLDPGQSADVAKEDVVGDLPDFGKKPGAADAANDDLATENAALKQQVADLTKQRDDLATENAALKQAPAAEPGPLDLSIDKLTEHLTTVTNADEVQKLLDAENAGKSRTGAIAALEARRDALLA